MNVLLLLSVFGVGFVLGETEEVPDKCMKLFHPRAAFCCKQRVIPPPDSFADIKECLNMTGPKGNHLHDKRHFGPLSCDVESCIAEKRGILADDGTIDEEALKKTFEKELTEYPDFLKKVTDNCVQIDKLDRFGKKDMCELKKLSHCIFYQIVGSCPEWFENHGCERMKMLADECNLDQ